MLDVGDKVALKPAYRCRAPYAERPPCITEYAWVYYAQVWVDVFVKTSHVDGVFRILRLLKTRDYGLIVQLQPVKNTTRCAIDWWVPIGVFEKYRPDWLEELPLATVA
jgi:hypothetical protein